MINQLRKLAFSDDFIHADPVNCDPCTIGVHDLRRPDPRDSLFQGFDAEVGVHRV